MELQFIDDVSSWESIAGAWNDLVRRSTGDAPFLRAEFLLAWWRTLGGGEWPDGQLRVAVARDGQGSLQAAAPLFTTTARPGALLLIGTTEIADYLDVVAPAEGLHAFASSLLEAVEGMGPEVDSLDLWNLLEDSPSLSAFEAEAKRRGWSAVRRRLRPSPYVAVAGGWESYLARLDKKQRHELRRKMRRAAAHPDGASFDRTTGGDDLPERVDEFLDLMATDSAKAAFLTPEMRRMFHALAAAAADHGWLRIDRLRLGGRLAAAMMCFDYDDRLWIYNSGLDPDTLAYSPGWVLLGHLIQEAADAGKREVDFLRGDEEYKVRLGGIVRHVERLTLSRPQPPLVHGQ